MEEPGEEGAGLLRFAGGEEGGDADGGVAGPGVAVVPVAVAADALGQRRGRRGDRRAGRRVGEQLQRDEAAHDGVAVVGDLDTGGPGAPAGLVAGQLGGGHRRRDDDERAAAGDGDDDRHRCAGADLEVDGPVDLDGGAVGRDGDGEVAVLAHQRTGSPRDARAPAGGRSRSGGRGGAGRAPLVRGR